MKGKSKQQKGITLIALIITIVVLLILAVVAINSIQNDGIIGHAQNAATKYNESVKNEQDILSYYEAYLGGKLWTQSKTTVTRGNQTLEVGDRVKLQIGEETPVEYSANGYAGEWRVLGAENGKLLLMSASEVGELGLTGKDGYNTCITKLNEFCEDYLNPTYATEARSVKLEDIDRITGYNPITDAQNYNKTYDCRNFIDLDQNLIENTVPLTNTYYSYEVNIEDAEAYALIRGRSYWLANQAIRTSGGDDVSWNVRLMQDNGESIFIGEFTMLHGMVGDYQGNNFKVRAVVVLKSDVLVSKI